MKLKRETSTYMDEEFSKISSDIFFLLLNLEIDFIS